jgi:hypothetical protein
MLSFMIFYEINTTDYSQSQNNKILSHLDLGAIQKIRDKIGEREGTSHLTRNVTVGEGGSWHLTRDKFLSLNIFNYKFFTFSHSRMILRQILINMCFIF